MGQMRHDGRTSAFCMNKGSATPFLTRPPAQQATTPVLLPSTGKADFAESSAFTRIWHQKTSDGPNSVVRNHAA